MRGSLGVAIALGFLAHVASAQAPPPEGPSTVVANPTYIFIPLEITVNRPAAEVWKRVGKYCDIGEWMQVPCAITAGKDEVPRRAFPRALASRLHRPAA